MTTAAEFTPRYSAWRHGGWYVDNVHYPSGAVGCVSRNYADRKWRIACDDRYEQTYASRDDAARAEYEIARALTAEADEVARQFIAARSHLGMWLHHYRAAKTDEERRDAALVVASLLARYVPEPQQ